METPTTPRSPLCDVHASLELIEIKDGVRFSVQNLKDLLPDVETALFFAAVYELDIDELSNLIQLLFHTNVIHELMRGDHSTELQGYIVDELNIPPVVAGQISFDKVIPQGEVLPHVWKQTEVVVAQSLKDVADRIKHTLGLMPGKQGNMIFQTMAKLNLRRPTIGVHQARIVHAPHKPNLFIMDDSGSVSRRTVDILTKDAVALGYMADAHFALVSNTCRHWAPGAYNTDVILAQTEIGGTYYETLVELLNRHDWGQVIVLADYDSSASARDYILQNVTTTIEQVWDVSLVDRPTFLAECVGQVAKKVQPLLIGNSWRVLDR